MVDDKLYREEAQRAANYEAVKSEVEAGVENEIVSRNVVATDDTRTEAIAADMRDNAVSEIAETHNEVQRGRVAARISQVVDYLFFILYGLFAIRLMLELFAAREGVGFFKIIKALTDPFYAPFRGLVPSLSTPDGFSLELSIVVAIVVYALLHFAINGLLRMAAHRKVVV